MVPEWPSDEYLQSNCQRHEAHRGQTCPIPLSGDWYRETSGTRSQIVIDDHGKVTIQWIDSLPGQIFKDSVYTPENGWKYSGTLFQVKSAGPQETSSDLYCVCSSPLLETRDAGVGATSIPYRFCLSCRKEKQ